MSNQPTLINPPTNDPSNLQASLISSEHQQTHKQDHVTVGQFLKSFIYGGLDGTINILVIIISSVSSGQSPYKVMAIGITATIADAIGMGLGDFLSYRSEQAFILSQKAREEYEIEHLPQKQLNEVFKVFQKQQYSDEESNRLSLLHSKNKNVFVNIMMLGELGLVVSLIPAWKIGMVNFSAFLVCGLLPLLPYIITAGFLQLEEGLMTISMIIGGVQLISLGIIKAKVIRLNGMAVVKSSAEMFICGVVVVLMGYGVGILFS